MIYKLQNSGIMPQIDATRVVLNPREYKGTTIQQDHDALVKWNLEHPNDKIYRIEDLIQKEKEANPSWVKRAANLAVNPIPTSNYGMMTAPNPNSPVKSTVKDELGIAMAAATAPMIGSEIGLYGGLGTGLRFGAGSTAAAGASYAGGKAGDWLDNKLGSNWIGDTNRLVLPFITFPVGMKGANSILRSAAGHGITMGMPQETFANLRSQYFTNAGNKAMAKAIPDVVQTNIEAGKIGWAPSSKQTLWHNSDQPLTKLDIRFPAWDTTQRGAPLGHSWFTGTETAQGFMGKRPYHLRGMVELNKPMIQIGESIGDGKNATRNQILDFAQKSSADGINFKGIADNTLKNQDVYAIFKNTEVKPKLTAAEQLGIPKQNRISLNQDQTEAADDLLWYLRNGRHKKYFLYNPETETFRWSSSKAKDGEIGAVRALIEHGATSSGHYEYAPVRLSNEYGNFTIWPDKNAAFTSNFPIPEGMKWGPGETSLMLEGDHSMKTILTSPRVDLSASMEDAPIELVNSLPNTIDKSIMMRFWSENDHMIRPGTYLSGDNGQIPLGNIAMSAFDRTKSVDSAIQSIINPKNARTGRTGLSPDSYSSIIRQGLRGNHKLRWGKGFTKWNDSAVENRAIYEAWKKMNAGEITPEQYKQIFDDWAIPLGGRPAEIRTTPSFRTIIDNDGITRTITQEPQKYVVMPHPYIMYRKQGGKI